jgi:O-succinylbenzoate synthase
VIEAVELRRVSLPLITPFRTSFGTEVVRDALLVHLLASDAEGWGECVAMSEPRYSPEYVDGAHEVIRRWLVPMLFAERRAGPGAEAAGGAGIGSAAGAVRGHPMARAAVETAVTDARLRAQGTSLASHLGGERTMVDVGVSVGIIRPVEALVDAVGAYVAAGYRRVKIKIEPGWDVEPLSAVRAAVGDDLALQVDANGAYGADGAYGREGALALAALDELGLVMIEQPLAEEDLAGHAWLAARLATPICLDESVTSSAMAALAIDVGACSIVNIKPGRVGGLAEARRIHDLCVERQVPVWCGGMLETGVGRAANLALASLPGFTLPADLSASDRYFRRDITPPFVLEDGRLRVPTGPGIGVSVLAEAVDELTTSVEVLRPD